MMIFATSTAAASAQLGYPASTAWLRLVRREMAASNKLLFVQNHWFVITTILSYQMHWRYLSDGGVISSECIESPPELELVLLVKNWFSTELFLFPKNWFSLELVFVAKNWFSSLASSSLWGRDMKVFPSLEVEINMKQKLDREKI